MGQCGSPSSGGIVVFDNPIFPKKNNEYSFLIYSYIIIKSTFLVLNATIEQKVHSNMTCVSAFAPASYICVVLNRKRILLAPLFLLFFLLKNITKYIDYPLKFCVITLNLTLFFLFCYANFFQA